MKVLRVGMIQMEVVFHEPERNLNKAAELVAKAVKDGAEICVLPECLDLGWGTPLAVEMAQPIPGKTSDHLCEIAKKNQVHLVAGITEKAGEKVYNTAVVINDEGELLGIHRKINVLTGVEDVYSIGDRVNVFDTKLGRLGVDICADNAFQSLSIGVTLARMGAEIILSPCAWAVLPDRDPITHPYGEEWHVPYGRLSGDFEIPIIGVSNVGLVPVGTWAGWKDIGNSIAYGRDGKVLEILPFGETAECVKVINVELGKVERLGTSLAHHVWKKEMARSKNE